MSNKMNSSLFFEHLQHTSATQLCPHVGGHAIPFPTHFEEFPMDVADGLKGYKLATTTKNGVNRFALRTPAGRILTPMDQDRSGPGPDRGGEEVFQRLEFARVVRTQQRCDG